MQSPSSSDSTPPSTPPSDNNMALNSSNNTNNSNNSNSNTSVSGKPQRKASRRASTAERRATHNAVERARREVLNGRFLDLAKILPNLSQVRRPSKSAIVNSSIAHFHATRRHRAMAARELRLLKTETDQLRMELNEWRSRAGIQRVEEPVRGEGFSMVLNQELEVIPVVNIGEDDEEGSVDDDYGIGEALPLIEEPSISVRPQPAPAPAPALNINTNGHGHMIYPPQQQHHQANYPPVRQPQYEPVVVSPTAMSLDNPALGMYDAGHINASPNFGLYNGGYRQRSGSMRSQGSASPPQYHLQKGYEQKLPVGYEPGWGGLAMNVNLGMGMNGMGMSMHGGF
ncbi:hypothetical protein E1B28_013192 [Marasmius oreades]|uniref:BHLH domain-containing protein n=1 Tax=Marasmius oreades TaxID=181124 RepID=A0A9P7ULS2_9AGAR|nr:uncharacterized protein E1B28_013192 [Marasmius oreades]KAG7087212.1 hypothetical protein E1B28_013192 [Marasmius oreades]